MKAEWKPLNDRKWELKLDEVVLATIHHRADNKFSLWVSTPIVMAKISPIIGETHRFPSLSEAQEAFEKLLQEKVLLWAVTVIKYVSSDV